MIAKVKEITKDTVTLELSRDAIEIIEELKDFLLDISIEKHSDKRSLNANSFMWVTLDKMARKIGDTTKWDLYLDYIKKKGIFQPVTAKKETLPMLKRQWRETEEVFEHDGYVDCLCYFGSSTYNQKQMGELIDEIVSDCKILKVDTLTPQQIERMVQAWDNAKGAESTRR